MTLFLEVSAITRIIKIILCSSGNVSPMVNQVSIFADTYKIFMRGLSLGPKFWWSLTDRVSFQENETKEFLMLFFIYHRFVRSSTAIWIIFNENSWTRCVDVTRWKGNFDTSRPRWRRMVYRSSITSPSYQGHLTHGW